MNNFDNKLRRGNSSLNLGSSKILYRLNQNISELTGSFCKSHQQGCITEQEWVEKSQVTS